MKRILIFMLLVLVVAVGCTQTTPEPAQNDSVQDQPPQEETTPEESVEVDEPPQEEEPEEEPEPTVDPMIEEFQEKLEGVDSYTYLYAPNNEMQEADQYSVRLPHAKIELHDRITIENVDEHYDTVYLNLEEKTALGVCEDEHACPEPGKEFDISYTDPHLPPEWLEGITEAEQIGSESIEGRTAITLEVSEDGDTFKMWVDEYYGMPLKVEKDGQTHAYTDMAFNPVLGTEVTPDN